MEERRGHIVSVQDRKTMLVTAVKDVDSFNLNEILLITERGNILIKGDNIQFTQRSLSS